MVLRKFPDENAPFKMTAKRDGECAECLIPHDEGDRIVWDPKEFKAYCLDCGEEVLPDAN